MNAIESNLARYLELERLLNSFFLAFNFCYDRCLTPKKMQNGGLPVAACCGTSITFCSIWIMRHLNGCGRSAKGFTASLGNMLG